jgi:DNA-binding NarL/FixJ family response regulator
VAALDDVDEGFWRVAIVEDHRLQRLRTEELISAQAGMRVVASFETFPDFMAWVKQSDARQRPHLLVLDLMVERGPSVDPTMVKRLVDAGMRILVLSALASPSLVREVLRAGVGGFVGKRDSESDIVAAAWAVLGRGDWITPELAAVMAGDTDRPRLGVQEERALILYASGLTLASVASALGVKPDTAKKYLARVKAKYAAVGRPVHTKVEMSRAALRDGFLTDAQANEIADRAASEGLSQDLDI